MPDDSPLFPDPRQHQRAYDGEASEAAAPQPSGRAESLGETLVVTRPKLSWRTGVAFSCAAVVLVAGAVAYAAYERLNGGGTQPDAVLPASAIAYAKLDLSPAANQKLAIYDLVQKIPGLAPRFTRTDSVSDDALSSMFSGRIAGIDYRTDIAPWLGKRIAIAAVPDEATGSGGVLPVIAVAYSDEAKMASTLNRVRARGVHFGYDTLKGYALISTSQSSADAILAQSKRSPLSANPLYRADVASLRGDQVAVAWADLARASARTVSGAGALGSLGTFPGVARLGNGAGRVVLGVHADPHYLELSGSLRGATSTFVAGERANTITKLPADTTAAVELTDLGATVDAGWSRLPVATRTEVARMAQRLGVQLPGDLASILGTDMILALGLPRAGAPLVGTHVLTQKPARAVEVLRRLLATFGQGQQLAVTMRTDANGYVVADSAAAADLVNGPARGGTLGSTEKFRQAVPDAGRASIVAYADLGAILHSSLSSTSAADRHQLGHLSALGVSMSPTADGGSFELRVTVD